MGSQFFVAQPGMELEAKKNKITQNAMVENTTANDCHIDSLFRAFALPEAAGAGEGAPWPFFS